MKKILIILIICSFGLNAQQAYEPKWTSIDSRPTPEWFVNSKFGIFIHWGVYSVPAWAPANISTGKNFGQKFSEWYWYRLKDSTNQYFSTHHKKKYGDKTYPEFAPEFTAAHFSPKKWAEIIKQSGARYVVLTSKHHDGYTLWPSDKSRNWNSVDIGPHRDLCGELSKAIKEEGLYMGFYYSLYEWFNPLYKNDLEKYVDTHMIPQMKDLVTRYKPDILWTDGEWDHFSSEFKSPHFLTWLFNESKVKNTIAINDRWGKETRSKHGGFYTTEYGHVGSELGIGENVYHPWEECRGIGGSFGWNRMENLENYSSSEDLIYMLIEKVANGGNFLLNIGPTHDGLIPVIMQQRLYDIGNWLKVNGEAIFDTKAWNISLSDMKQNKIFYTVKGEDLYVICTKWHNSFQVSGIGNVENVSLLGSNVKVKYLVKEGQLTIYAPEMNPENIPSDYAYTYKISNFEIDKN
ncbi:MAG: alpha-L-fucosidase [Flavobacteriaceae bacterium]|nr:alpha-L-fucosidase [Flavobacteriaceae bacterium]